MYHLNTEKNNYNSILKNLYNEIKTKKNFKG